MFCKKCGNILPDNAKFCTACGAPTGKEQANPYTSYQQSASPAAPRPAVGFVDAVKLFFRRYVDFHGRSRRSEYWWACLFLLVMNALLSYVLPDLTSIWSIVVLIPGIALCVRRLHDVGKSGWWYLFILLPVVGAIVLVVQFCKDNAGPNKWGPSLKY